MKTILDILRGKGIHLARLWTCQSGPRRGAITVAEQFEVWKSSVSFLPFMQEFRSVGNLQVYARSSWGWIYQNHAGLDIGDTTIGVCMSKHSGSIRPLLREVGMPMKRRLLAVPN